MHGWIAAMGRRGLRHDRVQMKLPGVRTASLLCVKVVQNRPGCWVQRTFQWRLRVQKSQIFMRQVQHSLVAGRVHTEHPPPRCVRASQCSPNPSNSSSSMSSPPCACTQALSVCRICHALNSQTSATECPGGPLTPQSHVCSTEHAQDMTP